MRRHGLVILTALALGAFVATTAGAKSTPQIRAAQQHARDVQARVAQIGMRLERTIQHYDHAQIQLQQAEASLRANEQKLHFARVNFRAAQQRIMARIYTMYVNGNPTALDFLAGAKSLSQIIDRAEAAQSMSRQDAQLGTQALAFERAVQRRQHTLAVQRQHRAQAVLALASEKRQIQAALGEQNRLLASIHTSIKQMQAQERAREAAARAAALARLRELQQERAAQQATITTSPVPAPPIFSNGSGHPEAARIALRYLGVPYVWGGASPSGFDCSGLVMYVYAQLGISLPHYTVSQADASERISQSAAQPGDLVFFNGYEHVGIYLGGGEMVDAPHTGAVVRTESIYGFGSIDGFYRVP